MRNQNILPMIKRCKEIHDDMVKKYNNKPNKCKHCGHPISYKKKITGNIFCNRSCAAIYNNKHHKIGKSATHLCKQCGKVISAKSMFCNDKCKILHKKHNAMFTFKDKLAKNTPISKESVRYYLLISREYKCNRCKLSEWLKLPIPLEVHHKDGNYKNNNDDNLELLCPTCHSITDNYRGKNRGNGRGEYKYRKKS